MSNPENSIHDNKGNRPSDLVSHLMGYIDTRIDMVRLELQTKLNAGFAGMLHAIMLGFTATMAFLFLNIFLGLLLNHLLHSSFWGFGIVTAFYTILFLLFYVGLDRKTFEGIAEKTFKNTIYKNEKPLN